MASTDYKHQPLRGLRSIRLIELEPSRSFGAPLKCKLVDITLDDHPPYEALSYSWDAQTSDSHVLCSNKDYLVTGNCEAAMRQLRPEERPRLLWIDSICIDQTSIPEKNHQIGLMEEIYTRAVEVLVWLGQGSKTSDMALRALVNGAKNPDKTHQRFGIQEDSVVRSLIWQSFITSVVYIIARPVMLFCGTVSSKDGRSPVSAEGQGGRFFSFFSRTVFERMWCVQEVAVASRVRLICGSGSITWEELLSALDYLTRLYDMVLESTVMVEMYKKRLNLQKELKDIIASTKSPYMQNARPWPSLSSLIIATRNRGATNPRDKVFALAGLFKYMGLHLPPPDYGQPVSEVYAEITRAAISQFRQLDMLYHVTGFDASFTLPSWAPDLSDTHPPMPLEYNAFKASGASPVYYKFSDTLPTLSLWGKPIAKITSLGAPILFCAHPATQTPPSPDEEEQLLLQTFKQWSSIAHTIPAYPNSMPVPEAFARTLFTNGIFHDIRGPSDFLAVFPTWHDLVTSATSYIELHDPGVENMLRDISAIAPTAIEQREFALQVCAATLGVSIASTVSRKNKRAKMLNGWLAIAMRRKAFFALGNGYIGVAAGSAAAGDEVVLFSGLKAPFLCRQVQGGWRLLGPAYVHGIMEGELWDEKARLDEFALV